MGWGEGLDLCELENAPEMQKCPKYFVHDCLYSCAGREKTEIDNEWQMTSVVTVTSVATVGSVAIVPSSVTVTSAWPFVP